jgi:hypothetical protein
MLTDHQIAQFHRTGYLSLEHVIGLVDVVPPFASN